MPSGRSRCRSTSPGSSAARCRGRRDEGGPGCAVFALSHLGPRPAHRDRGRRPVVAGQTVVAEIEPIPAFLDVRSEAQAKAAIRTAEAARTWPGPSSTSRPTWSSPSRGQAPAPDPRRTISQRRLDEDERSYKTAKANLATAQAALDMRGAELERARAELLSPLGPRPETNCPASGDRTGQRPGPAGDHESEGVVSPGQPLIEIGDPEDLDRRRPAVDRGGPGRGGQRVLIEEWGGGVLNGRVSGSNPLASPRSPPWASKSSGSTSSSTSPIPRSAGSAWATATAGGADRALGGRGRPPVPLSALFRDGGAWAVSWAGGRAEKRLVSWPANGWPRSSKASRPASRSCSPQRPGRRGRAADRAGTDPALLCGADQALRGGRRTPWRVAADRP